MNNLAIASKNLKVTEFGIEETGNATAEEIQSALKSVMKVDTMLQFYIGDLINIASYKWGEKYDKWEQATGYEYKTLKQFSYVATRFPASFREAVCLARKTIVNVVSFDSFLNVASLSDEKALYFLEMVRDGGWSRDKLRDEIARSKNGGTLPEPKTYELPDGFAPIKEAQTQSYVPAPEVVGETKKVIRRLIEVTDYEAELLLDALEENAKLVSFCERLQTAFGDKA